MAGASGVYQIFVSMLPSHLRLSAARNNMKMSILSAGNGELAALLQIRLLR
jgi:hypothetical protein